jgi:LuxR family transcriptional regulator, quorum-sensing system regulator BjaR1
MLVLQITPLERDALQLLALGKAPEEIASCLSIRASDVKSHLARLFAAMGAANESEAVAVALKRGLVTVS